MALAIGELLAGLVKPITDLIGEMHTSTEEKGKLQLALAQLQVGFAASALDYEAKLLEQQASVVRAEAQGASWLQRSWRPITMLTFLGLIVADTFGLTRAPIPPEMWTLLQLGMTGYVAGRTIEKVLPGVMDAVGSVRVGGKKP
jgi:hypothetical protein